MNSFLEIGIGNEICITLNVIPIRLFFFFFIAFPSAASLVPISVPFSGCVRTLSLGPINAVSAAD